MSNGMDDLGWICCSVRQILVPPALPCPTTASYFHGHSGYVFVVSLSSFLQRMLAVASIQQDLCMGRPRRQQQQQQQQQQQRSRERVSGFGVSCRLRFSCGRFLDSSTRARQLFPMIPLEGAMGRTDVAPTINHCYYI
jgi:hypothetical protein